MSWNRDLFLLFSFTLCCSVCLYESEAYSVHMVTFNVKENKNMPKGVLNGPLAAKLLQLGESGSSLRDIYVVALQENCYKCNSKSLKEIADVFLEQLNKQGDGYSYIGVVATRNTNTCEMMACSSMASQHGTSLTMVFARRGLVKSFDGRRRNRCMTGAWLMRNAEKGLAGMKLLLKNGRKLCFVSGHLDAKSVQGRQACIAAFFGGGEDDFESPKNLPAGEDEDADDRGNKGDPMWYKDCDAIFLAGDMNTRTGEKDINSDKKDGVVGTTDAFKKLIELDELSGSKPYTGESLLKFIKDTTQRAFVEPLRPIVDVSDFVATYSMLEKSQCKQKAPCYNPKRPFSWTDRIVCHNCGKVLSYKPLLTMHDLSDHLPVVGVFENV